MLTSVLLCAPPIGTAGAEETCQYKLGEMLLRNMGLDCGGRIPEMGGNGC